MVRLVVAFVIIAAFAGAAAWLADQPGAVVLEWGGYQIETTAGIAILAIVLIAVFAALLYRGWRGLRQAPWAIGAARSQARLRKGHRALSRGMLAVAAGDARSAGREARRAAALLEEPPLTLLLSAQAAQLAGDRALAEKQFQAMLQSPETEFLGIRGLLSQAGRDGDRDKALQLAQRAIELRPDMPWVTEISFELQAEAGHWRQAEAALDRGEKKKLFAPDESRRHRAVLRYARAFEAAEAGQTKEALPLARYAHQLAPDFVPATVLVARLLAETDKHAKAERVISDAWARTPHAALAALWQEFHTGDPPAERLASLEVLKTRNPDHPETHILIAAAALAAEDWTTMRESLARVTSGGEMPDDRVCRLMAEYEEIYRGDAKAAREWLMRAAVAPGAGRWQCSDCGHGSTDYAPRCPACGGFDTLRSEIRPLAKDAEIIVAEEVPTPAEAGDSAT